MLYEKREVINGIIQRTPHQMYRKWPYDKKILKKFFSCTPDRQNIKVLVKSIIEFLRKKKHFAKISIFPLKYM